jgi:hypothetical protein
VVQGRVKTGETVIGRGNLLVSKAEDTCQLQVAPKSHLLVFGGQPFPEERFIHWNFVSSTREKLEKAKADWKAKAFPKVPGDETYVPLPE